MNFTNDELDVSLGICAATIGVLAFANEFPDKKYLKILKSLSFKLIVFVLATVIGVWATLKKNTLADAEKATEKLNSQKEQRKNDSNNRILTQESNGKIVTAFTTSLAKYGLKYDSAENVIKKLVKDSSKRQIIYGNHPELAVNDISIEKSTKDTILFSIKFYTKQAASYHTTIKQYMVTAINNQPLTLVPDEDNRIFLNDVLIPTDKTLQLHRSLTGDLGNSNGTVYFVSIGRFFDSDNKEFSFKVINSFDLTKKLFGSVMEPTNSEIVNLLHQNGINY